MLCYGLQMYICIYTSALTEHSTPSAMSAPLAAFV